VGARASSSPWNGSRASAADASAREIAKDQFSQTVEAGAMTRISVCSGVFLAVLRLRQ
jgi:hypothetical protein